jgi:hypothetical protein
MIAKDLIQEFPEDFNLSDYKISLSRSLKELFNANNRYVDLDGFIEKVAGSKNINCISLLDCCREKPATKGMKDEKKDTSAMGMSSTFYAKCDGGLALAGNKGDMLSPTTAAWIYFIKANPGGEYPLILGEFQYSVINRCDNKVNTTRQVVLV